MRPFICQNPLAVLQSRAEKRAFSKCKQKLFTDGAQFTPGSRTCSPSGIVLKHADYFKYGAFTPFYQDILSTLFSCSGKYNWHKQYIWSYWEIFKNYIFQELQLCICRSDESRSTQFELYTDIILPQHTVTGLAESSSLLKAPNGSALIFLCTHDSCFIYWLGCSQHCLSISAVSSQTLEVTDPL